MAPRANSADAIAVPSRFAALVRLLGIVFLIGCDAGKTKIIGTEWCGMAPGAPSDTTDPFYRKYLDGRGIPVQSSAAVSDAALGAACMVVVRMLSMRDDVREAMVGQEMRVAVIGLDEVTTDMPEYRDLYTMFPGQDWDALRGVGATLRIPVSSVGEENLLCLATDVNAGGHVLVQSFATSVLLGVEAIDSTFDSRLKEAYDAAISAGRWEDTFLRLNTIEYFAGGVQAWFDASVEASPPDGTHNEVNTRAELRDYDPMLAALIAEVMPDTAWRPQCP
jgi:hypothetical protein